MAIVFSILLTLSACQQCNDGSGDYIDDQGPYNKFDVNNYSTDTIVDIYYPQIGKSIKYSSISLQNSKKSFPYFYLLNCYATTTIYLQYKSGKVDTVSLGYDRSLEYSKCSSSWMKMSNLKMLQNTIDSSFVELTILYVKIF